MKTFPENFDFQQYGHDHGFEDAPELPAAEFTPEQYAAYLSGYAMGRESASAYYDSQDD